MKILSALPIAAYIALSIVAFHENDGWETLAWIQTAFWCFATMFVTSDD